MDELLDLLNRYDQGIEALSTEELTELLSDIRSQSEALFDADPTDEQLDALERAAAAVTAIEAALAADEAAAAERREHAERLRGQILGQEDGEPAAAEDDDAAGDGDEPAADEPAGGEGADEQLPIAAAASRVTRAVARRPAAMQPRPPATPDREPMQLVAAANLPDVAAGAPLDNPLDLARAFMSAYNSAKGYRGPRVKIPVARIGGEARDLYGPDRYLGRDLQRNAEVIERVLTREARSHDAVAAAGGICAPINVNYDMPTIGTDARPVRDTMMTRFGADRGGVSTFPPPILTDVTGSVAEWTEANDRHPTSPTTKPCLTVTCPDPETTLVEAITRCFEFGNFRQRFFPEQVQAWTELGAVSHARFAETRLLTSMGAGSTQVSSGQLLDATIDVLTTLDRAVAAIENRWRIADDGIALRFGAPAWLHDMMRSGIVRQINGTGTYDEKYAIADAQIQRWIEARGVNMTWFLDGEAGQVFGPQGDGPLLGWPSTVVTYLYPEGSWLFLDGGELDLGIVRDSTLNSTNDYQMFYESFEGAHFNGVESYRLTMDLCPDGTVSGTVDIAPCSTGS